MRNKFLLFRLLSITVFTITLFACNGTSPVEIQTAQTTTGTIVDKIQATGRVEAVRREVIRAKESIGIESVNVEEGDIVSAGTRLVNFDLTMANEEVRSATLKLEQADIELLRAKNQLKSSERAYADPAEREVHLMRQKSAYKTALIEKNAREREYRIIKELYDIGSESLTRLKQKEDLIKQADIKVKQAEKEIEEASQGVKNKDKTNVNREKLEADYEIALRQKKLAATQLQFAEDRLKRLKTVSPFNGTVTRVHVDPGMIVPAGQPIVTVSDLNKLQVRASVDEVDGGKIRVGQNAGISFEAFPDKSFFGKVSWVAPEAIVREMRTLVEALIKMDESTGLLKLANQVDIEIIVKEKAKALLIPIDALYHDPSPFVWRLNDNKAVKTPVETGISDLTHIEIISGLKIGDSIIYDDHHQLSDQTPVKAK